MIPDYAIDYQAELGNSIDLEQLICLDANMIWIYIFSI